MPTFEYIIYIGKALMSPDEFFGSFQRNRPNLRKLLAVSMFLTLLGLNLNEIIIGSGFEAIYTRVDSPLYFSLLAATSIILVYGLKVAALLIPVIYFEDSSLEDTIYIVGVSTAAVLPLFMFISILGSVFFSTGIYQLYFGSSLLALLYSFTIEFRGLTTVYGFSEKKTILISIVSSILTIKLFSFYYGAVIWIVAVVYAIPFAIIFGTSPLYIP